MKLYDMALGALGGAVLVVCLWGTALRLEGAFAALVVVVAGLLWATFAYTVGRE